MWGFLTGPAPHLYRIIKIIQNQEAELERPEAKRQGTEIRNTSGARTVNQPGLKRLYLTALTPSHTQASRFSVGGGAM